MKIAILISALYKYYYDIIITTPQVNKSLNL